jgi:hypothetical protein
MSILDWYYVHSPRYDILHKILLHFIDKTKFNPVPLFVEQEVFDKDLYKHKDKHFFTGISIKIEKIIEIIEGRCSSNVEAPFLFTDCDVIVTKYASFTLPSYAQRNEIDIYFQRETLTTTTVNPGCMIIHPNERTLYFFKTVLDDITKNKKMEMDSINELLHRPDNKVKFFYFNTSDVCSSITKTHSTFSIYHILSNCVSKEFDMQSKYLEIKMLNEMHGFYGSHFTLDAKVSE